MSDVPKVLILWGAGLLTGLILRAIIPPSTFPSLFIVREKETYVLPLNRIAFWICIGAGLVAGLLPLAKVIMHDLMPGD